MITFIEERRKAKERFASYVSDYDMNEPKISLKAVHTYKVAELCEDIAGSLGLGEEECFIAWMCGLLHDIGRFEQVTRYNTFVDADSMDHALLSTQILFGETEGEEGILREFIDMTTYDDILYKAIRYHSSYRVPEELTKQEKMYCDILRDADKIAVLGDGGLLEFGTYEELIAKKGAFYPLKEQCFHSKTVGAVIGRPPVLPGTILRMWDARPYRSVGVKEATAKA